MSSIYETNYHRLGVVKKAYVTDLDIGVGVIDE